MQVTVLDGQGAPQTVLLPSPVAAASIIDQSGALVDAASKVLMIANEGRSGWFFQNIGAHVMRVNDLGADATLDGAFLVWPGGVFPPPGYVVSTGEITVSGTALEKYSAREW